MNKHAQFGAYIAKLAARQIGGASYAGRMFSGGGGKPITSGAAPIATGSIFPSLAARPAPPLSGFNFIEPQPSTFTAPANPVGGATHAVTGSNAP